jgi:HlyD family secretion protein
MRMMYKLIVVLMLVISLTACSRKPSIKNGHLLTLESHSCANTLFYSGSILPLQSLVVTSQTDGVVIEMPIQYGDTVKPGQLIFMISSGKFLSDYKAALMQYMKAKNEFNNSEMQLAEAVFLHKNLLISDDDFKSKQSNFYASQLGLLQAKDTFETFLQQLDVKEVNFNKLTIADIDKITKAMHLQRSSENLRIIAPVEGVILSPTKGEEDSKRLVKGDQVKQGDVLAVIGDMQGISVRVKVNELIVNQLKVGMSVKVTGIAFPNDTLMGEIKRVDRQGEATSGGLPTFLVEVIVPKLTPAQQKDIHVGMSAKVEIDIEEAPQLLIPIKAVTERNGESYVQLYDKKANKLTEVMIKTGKTSIDSVAVNAGLKVGDEIVIPN